IWDIAANRQVFVYRGHVGNTINTLAWSPGGMAEGGLNSAPTILNPASTVSQYTIASAASDSTVHVWNATTGQAFAIYRGHTGSVNALSWSPTELTLSAGHGYYIVSGGEDASVQTWEAST